jgi:hypothetical protein
MGAEDAGIYAAATNAVFFVTAIFVTLLGEVWLAISLVAVTIASSLYHVERDTSKNGGDLGHASKWDEITAINAGLVALYVIGGVRPFYDPTGKKFDDASLGSKFSGSAVVWGTHLACFGAAFGFNFFAGNDPDFDYYYIYPFFAFVGYLVIMRIVMQCFGWSHTDREAVSLGFAFLFTVASIGLYFGSHAHGRDLWLHGSWHITAAAAVISIAISRNYAFAEGDLIHFILHKPFMERLAAFDVNASGAVKWTRMSV